MDLIKHVRDADSVAKSMFSKNMSSTCYFGYTDFQNSGPGSVPGPAREPHPLRGDDVYRVRLVTMLQNMQKM